MLQHPGLRSTTESLDQASRHARGLLVGVVCLTEPEVQFPVSAAVARFVNRLAGLSAKEWETVQSTIGNGGVDLTMLEASRNAAVALAVRDLISREQFNDLYRPFVVVIPIESLEAVPILD
ncbi:MAG: hypothetical protein M3003_09690 [Candidatus Dormibacteraeota bacterium]|nr:hypothetical protein [Candidatus Dormibacteraeota bacterium]